MTAQKFDNKNALIITLDDGTIILQSYQTPVAAIIDGKPYRTAQRWSVTTSQQIGKFWSKMRADLIASAPVEERPQAFFYELANTPAYLRK